MDWSWALRPICLPYAAPRHRPPCMAPRVVRRQRSVPRAPAAGSSWLGCALRRPCLVRFAMLPVCSVSRSSPCSSRPTAERRRCHYRCHSRASLRALFRSDTIPSTSSLRHAEAPEVARCRPDPSLARGIEPQRSACHLPAANARRRCHQSSDPHNRSQVTSLGPLGCFPTKAGRFLPPASPPCRRRTTLQRFGSFQGSRCKIPGTRL
jgi:hypothetical protein